MRLAAIIAVSCLLHAALLAAPLFGATTLAAQRIPAASNSARSLAIRLVPSTGSITADGVAIAAEPVVEVASRVVENLPSPDIAHQPAEVAPHAIAPGWLSDSGPGSFYPSSALTIKPRPLTGVDGVDVDAPQLDRIIASGRMIMTLWIDADGEVHDVTVETSELPGMFSAPSIEAFRKLRFAPGELNGHRVGTVMTIEVNYDDPRMPISPTVLQAIEQPSS